MSVSHNVSRYNMIDLFNLLICIICLTYFQEIFIIVLKYLIMVIVFSANMELIDITVWKL